MVSPIGELIFMLTRSKCIVTLADIDPHSVVLFSLSEFIRPAVPLDLHHMKTDLDDLSCPFFVLYREVPEYAVFDLLTFGYDPDSLLDKQRSVLGYCNVAMEIKDLLFCV